MWRMRMQVETVGRAGDGGRRTGAVLSEFPLGTPPEARRISDPELPDLAPRLRCDGSLGHECSVA